MVLKVSQALDCLFIQCTSIDALDNVDVCLRPWLTSNDIVGALHITALRTRFM